ncbi:hypothetical protein AVEN_57887-1 [Araneus ventricosus]|uniref:Pre-C2HC domain-containing protein n=1 Tax=Araneus ventricosus TaxID=182803 RepID=A0A4Y2TNT2_ARAVE|nr:hypothetical protein AVEN_44686-1 [Araneus ventricosus]GBO01415.1 hypothetical protein AVEN_156382-1 [Araneus ventricosus]GBO01437.1 hypothetical protein AVEN_41645-1 [Araneus ventricosus]GBO01438.1 hypothetical protein AVEN_57887-1 [Araneus ventricosus]
MLLGLSLRKRESITLNERGCKLHSDFRTSTVFCLKGRLRRSRMDRVKCSGMHFEWFKYTEEMFQNSENLEIGEMDTIEENILKEAPKSIPEINLKIIPNFNLVLKEINQQFPNTENRLRREFIGIKGDTKENREKFINLLKQKNLEFVLSEAYEDRPVKVVIRDLPIDMEITEIIQNLEGKGYKIGRATPMKNYKEKKTTASLPRRRTEIR